jgi:alpha-tubulin suppressor-like RCC1 family protein
MAFISNPDGDLKNAFISDSWLLDQFVGNTLFTWGYNGYGRLGNNNITNISNPIQTIALGTNWKQVTCGYTNTAAIKTDGTLWTWGKNINGQLGDNTVTNRSSPVQTIMYGTNWKQVSCGSVHTAAIKTDGTLWGFGYNIYGQLGDNTRTDRSSPVQTVAFGTNWKQVSCGYTNTAAIKTDGTLWVFGYNIYGQIGDSTITNRSSPVQTIAGGTSWKQVACGYTSTVAIKTDGTLWTWGYNGYGQLGDNTIINRSSPVQTVAGGTNWKQVASGYLTTAAIKADGTLWVWGKGIYGQLGDNAIVSRSSPVQTIAYGTNWKQVVCSNHTAAIKTDGTLWTWGFNSYGQLGDNTITRKSSPVQTSAGGTSWKQINCGYLYTAATTNGDI